MGVKQSKALFVWFTDLLYYGNARCLKAENNDTEGALGLRIDARGWGVLIFRYTTGNFRA